MTTLSADTQPGAESVQIELLRQPPPWRKLQLVGQMIQTCRMPALSGLRHRHPDETPEGLLLRLAMRCWGARQHLACMVKCWRGRHQVLREAIAVSLLVVHVLKALGVPHLIGGSLASAPHGAVRATMDAHLLDRALSEAGLEKG